MPRKPKTLLKDTHPDIAAQLIDKSLLQTLGTGSDKSVEWECEHGHRWFAKVVSRTNAKNKTGCPVCAGKKVIPGINDLATLRPDIASTAVIDGKQAAIFLDANHIQGHVIATRHYALLDDQNRIRAVMSLRSPRNNARMHRRPGEWEIQRYATRGCVAGGFSKLLAHAEHDLHAQGIELRRWISLSSNDISDGNLYERCGFTRDGEVTPNYYYVGNSTGWRRMPKESYQRRRFRNDPELIWDESWTERQAAETNQLYRVYDSGKVRWVKDVD